MKITHIAVKGLFGLFNYEIPLRLNDRITIIHGPNGCGKTTILRLLDALMHSQFNTIRRMYFDQFNLQFDDNSDLQVIRTTNEPSAQQNLKFDDVATGASLAIRYNRPGSETEVYDLGDAVASRPEVQRIFPHLDRYLPFLQRIAPDQWRDAQDGAILNIDDVLDRYASHLPIPTRTGRAPMPDWLSSISNFLCVHFIQTQRLLRFGPRPNTPQPSGSHRVTVAEYSEDFVNRTRQALAASVNQSQDLDRTFPVRVLNEPHDKVTINVVRALYQKQQEKRKRLTDAGLISQQMGIMDLPVRQVEPVELRLLWLYLNDADTKLNAFDDLLEKIEIFKEIINSRFLHKSFKADREQGFVFHASNRRPIPLDSLSSGEQHELVLAYELLFRVKAGSLILIDEPELSLHVTWQHRFLEDLSRISKLANLDFIVATHSPQIMHKHWDLAVPLGSDE
jgi:predicted ATP-binding protein involved in virulence